MIVADQVIHRLTWTPMKPVIL